MNPAILVMDEPTAGLDPGSRREIISLLKNFTHTRIITSHDLDMVAEVSDRVIVMHEGRIRADGLTEDIFTDQTLLAACRLEPPLSMQPCAVCGRR
jgi:cobalt/nickel transport system ATP-binding protein